MNFPAQNGRILGLDWRNLHMSCRIIVRLAEFTNYHTHCADLVLKYKAPKSLKDELLIAKHKTSFNSSIITIKDSNLDNKSIEIT